MCAFIVLSLVFLYWAKRVAWWMSPKWPILCRVGRKTTTQSITAGSCAYHDRHHNIQLWARAASPYCSA